jgi:hypothetical protein
MSGTRDRRKRAPIFKESADFPSDIEEHRLVIALHADVETVERGIAATLFVGNQSPTTVTRNQRQDGIGGVGRRWRPDKTPCPGPVR